MKGEVKLPFLDGLQEKNFPKERAENMVHLRAWLSYQHHLPALTDEHLHLFLHSCYDNLERTKKTIETYFTMKTMSPDLFAKRDPLGSDVQLAFDISDMAVLPDKTPEGYKVTIYRLSDTAANKFIYLSMVKTFFMVNDMLLSEDGLVAGYLAVFDMKGFSLAHLARMSVSTVSKFMFYIQECHPARLKGVHIINTAPFMDKVLALIKPFMQTGLIKMLHLHGPVESLQDVIPLDIMPEEYGGKAKPLSQLHAEMRRLMETRYVDYFQQEMQLRVDETKRVGKSPVPDTMFGLEGSFRKLDID